MSDFAAFSPLVTHVLPEPNYTAGTYDKRILTLHDIECPPGLDWAESLGGPNYLQDPTEQHSVHFVVDGDSIVQGRGIHDWAWHCGSPGSRPSIGIEQAGYATFTRAQWLGSPSAVGTSYQRPDGSTPVYTADDAVSMASQIDLMAQLFHQLSVELSIDMRWLEGRESNTAVQGGMTGWNRHRDMSDFVDGTTTSHHDTGDNYPTDVLLAKVQALAGNTPVIIPPTPKPAPASTDWLDTVDKNELSALLDDRIKAGLSQVATASSVGNVASGVNSIAAAVKHIDKAVTDTAGNVTVLIDWVCGPIVKGKRVAADGLGFRVLAIKNGLSGLAGAVKASVSK